MNWIPYNPADAFYKSVPGAVETDRPFRLRLILPRAFGATGAHFLLQRDGATGTKIAAMEEILARALKMRWTAYDLPGELKW